MVGFEKALGAVKVIKDQIQYRSQSLLNLAHDYFSTPVPKVKEYPPGSENGGEVQYLLFINRMQGPYREILNPSF